jgi:hypothetical protein
MLIVAANAIPVYGAATGQLFFFQVIYLYWFESLLLILFDCIKIGAARGHKIDGGAFAIITKGGIGVGAGEVTALQRIGLILRTLIVRTLLLLFYLLFIVLFVMLQVTSRDHMVEAAKTIGFANSFFNTAVWVFIISNLVQLIGPFFINRQYREMAPHNYATIFDGRTIMLHVMIALGVFMHKFLFEGKAYESMGEAAYVGIFMLIKTVLDIRQARKERSMEPVAMPMI